MQIICKDGTTIPCDDFEATESGIQFTQKIPSQRQSAGEGEEEKSEEQESEEARGFVPLAELHFVLPDQMVQPQQPRTATGQQRTGQMAQRGQPQQGGMTQQTGMAQQQQMQQPSSSPQQTNR